MRENNSWSSDAKGINKLKAFCVDDSSYFYYDSDLPDKFYFDKYGQEQFMFDRCGLCVKMKDSRC